MVCAATLGCVNVCGPAAAGGRVDVHGLCYQQRSCRCPWSGLCQGPALTKIPLANVGALGFRNVSKEYKDNKTEKHGIVPGGNSSEY